MTLAALILSWPPLMQMPSPGAVWPAMVMLGCSMAILPPSFFFPVSSMMPETSKTTMRSPALTASWSEPGPLALRLVHAGAFHAGEGRGGGMSGSEREERRRERRFQDVHGWEGG
jgi:hypothetical protein